MGFASRHLAPVRRDGSLRRVRSNNRAGTMCHLLSFFVLCVRQVTHLSLNGTARISCFGSNADSIIVGVCLVGKRSFSGRLLLVGDVAVRGAVLSLQGRRSDTGVPAGRRAGMQYAQLHGLPETRRQRLHVASCIFIQRMHSSEFSCDCPCPWLFGMEHLPDHGATHVWRYQRCLHLLVRFRVHHDTVLSGGNRFDDTGSVVSREGSDICAIRGYGHTGIACRGCILDL